MTLKKLLPAALCALSLLTACEKDKDVERLEQTYDFLLAAADYTAEGYYNQVYNTNLTNLVWFPDLITTHKAEVETWDGVEYKSWYGMCPSSSTDKDDHTAAGDWPAYQWGSCTGGGVKDRAFMLCCWDTREKTSAVPEKVSVGFGLATGGEMKPQQCYITNSNYAYWAMKNGTAFSAPFGNDDWCKVTITGIDDQNRTTGKIDVFLAENGHILNTWQLVDLTRLGTCTAVYFQMFSSDTGQFGMNTPAYFCLDELTVVSEY